MTRTPLRPGLLPGLLLVLAVTACPEAVIKDGKIEVTNVPEDCQSFAISLSYTEDGVRRAETLGGDLNGATEFGPVELSPRYLDRSYEADAITITVVCDGESKLFRNRIPIYVPPREEKEIDTGDFDER